MGELSERLDSLTVRVMSPDGNITAVLRNRFELSLTFHAGKYRQYRESSLEHQLSRLGSMLWVGWQRGYAQAIAERNMSAVTETSASDKATRRFLRERYDLVGSSSPDKTVRAKSRGLREWRFKLEPGCLETLGESAFSTAAIEAATDAFASYNVKLEALKRECFDHPIANQSPRRRLTGPIGHFPTPGMRSTPGMLGCS